MLSPQLFITLATEAELKDKNSWINNQYQWPQEPFDELCKTIGQAITAWAMLEGRLFGIYMLSLGASSYKSAVAVWEAQTGFRPRLKMTDASLKANERFSFDEGALKKLFDRCEKKSARRNAIAHSTMYYDHMEQSTGRKFFLSADSTSSRIYTYDVIAFRDAFLAIADDLAALWSSLHVQLAT